MQTVRQFFADLWAHVQAWVLRNVLRIAVGALALFVGLLLFTGKKSQDVKEDAVKAATEAKLTRKQVGALAKSNKQLEQNKQVEQAKGLKLKQSADSTAHIASMQTKRADSAVHQLLHPVVPDDGLPEHVARRLLDYKPVPYVLPNGDTLR